MMTWAPCPHGVRTRAKNMAGGTLDIIGGSDEEQARTVPHLQSSPGWITQQKRQAFLYGCPETDHLAKAQAYQALHTPSAVQSYLGLDASIGMCRTSDVRAQPIDKDPGYPAAKQQDHGPDTAAIIECLLRDRELIESCDMIYVIVDNRAPKDVGHWPAFAQWWAARRNLVGPQHERTDLLWVQATHANGLRTVPYYWAGVFLSWKQLGSFFLKCILASLTMNASQLHSLKCKTLLPWQTTSFDGLISLGIELTQNSPKASRACYSSQRRI